MDILAYLDTFEKFTKDPTLKGMEFLLGKLGDPHKDMKFIHVAGTNGKGSICEILSEVLIREGYTVGKFMTPHLIDIGEEIQVNNKMISYKEYEEILEKFPPWVEEYDSKNDVKIKCFEVRTSVSLEYFKQKKCDIVVLETGLGGLTDCTNIVDSEISVIANIGYDHMDILGDTIEKIAKHKAGIIKQGKDTVFVYQKDVIDTIEKTCKEKDNKLHLIKPEELTSYKYNEEYQAFDYDKWKSVEINLKGKVQIQNAAICLKCFDILSNKGFKVSENTIRGGLKNVVHKARFEILKKEPIILFDGGHNESAISNLKENLKQYYKNRKVVYIVSILRTKDYKTILKLLLENNQVVCYLTNGTGEEKYVTKEELYEEAKKYTENTLYKVTLKEAITESIEKYKEEVVCISGSFYVYSNVKNILNSL